MRTKAEVFFDAVTGIREALVEEAQEHVFRRRSRVWRNFGSLAACLVLVTSLGLLAVLPRGCGGAAPDMSGSGNANNSPAPASSEPAAPPPDAPGGSNEDGYGGGAAQEPSGGEPLLLFSGQVLEVLEDGLLVEPLGGGLTDLELVRIPTAGLEDLPELRPGDVVTVLCGEVSVEDGEAVADGVTEIWLTEP